MLLADSAQAVEGKLYILGGGWNITGPEPSPSGIAIYIVAFFFAITVQTSNSAKFVKLVQSMPPGPPPPGAEPPPEVVALGNKLKMGGQFLAIAVIVIAVLHDELRTALQHRAATRREKPARSVAS